MGGLDALVHKAIESFIERELPHALETTIAEKLERQPAAQLSNAGFGWALSIALRKHWPDVDGRTAARWLWGYVGVPFGTPGYEWSYAAARELATDYVEQYGEPRP